MRKFIIGLRLWVRRSPVAQIGILILFWGLGEALASFTHLPLPGGIIGLLIVLGLLATRRLSLSTLRRGAEWFLAEMLLFFIPAALAVVSHRELFGLLGVKILAVICMGTLTVMGVTAVTVDLCYRWRRARVGADAAAPITANVAARHR